VPTAAPFEQQVVFLFTADLVATTRFYRDLLGLPLALDQGTCRIFRVSRDGYLGFCERPDAVQPGGVIATFVHRDVETRVAELKARGVVFEKDLASNAQYRITHAFFRDPSGHLLEVQRFDDPDWLALAP
jgi:catechol 2,3-dioxygenase-like lactoylglutathione lyase family enzyme